jgi:23S rRNA (adenine-N6)-dimethyltransferase
VPEQRAASRSRLGQHFFASTEVARRFVDDAGIDASDCVVEIGAGTGILTEVLAARAALVVAVEVDARLTRALVRRFAPSPNVVVWGADARDMPLPASRYRVVANLPFAITNPSLRALLDNPNGGLVRADLVVQWQVARARVRVQQSAPTDLLGALWAPWWEFGRGRRLPARCFMPAPRVDAAVLRVVRRAPPLLGAEQAERYRAWVRREFAADSAAARARTPTDWIRAAHRRGVVYP